MRRPRVARRIKFALEKNNMRPIDLANKSGMSISSITHYVNGRYCPNNLRAIELGKILNVAPWWLMDFDVEDDINKLEGIVKEYHLRYGLPETQEEPEEEPNEEPKGYYVNDETIKMAQRIKDDKNLAVLFDATKDVSPEILQETHKYLQFLKSREKNDT